MITRHPNLRCSKLEAIGKLHDSALSPRRFRVESFGMEGISRVEVVTMVILLPGGGVKLIPTSSC